MSVPPTLVRLLVPAPGSKSAVPWKDPVVSTLPEASTAMLLPRSIALPPRCRAQTKLPALSSLETKMSWLPPALDRLTVPAPGSKSTDPMKKPVVSTLPAASTAMPLPASFPVPPIWRTQTKFPALSSLETKMSVFPALVRLLLPIPGSKSAVP